MKCAIVVALLLVGATALLGQSTEMLRTFDNRSRPIYYDDRDIDIQAARFSLSGVVSVTDIKITLDGPVGGEARLRLFGSEGGNGAPFYGDDLVTPVVVRKSRPGVETVVATLPQPVMVESEQFFVGVDRISEGTHLLSDSRVRPPRCVGEQDSYSDQLIKTKAGLWRWGKYGYLIEVAVEPEKRPDNALFQEVGADRGIDVPSVSNHLISWGDINNDGYIDLLAGGYLFRNNRDNTFENITESAGVIAGSKFHCFLDQNADGDLDIVAIGASDECSGPECAWLLRNDGNGEFRKVPLTLPGITDPRCFSITDLNNDGLPDIYIGQVAGAGAESRPHLLYENRGEHGFALDSLTLSLGQNGIIADIGAQFTDINGDSYSDLFISITGDSASRLMVNNKAGMLLPMPLKLNPSSQWGSDAGGNWRDLDGGGAPELLLPRTNWRRVAGSDLNPAGSSILSLNDDNALASTFERQLVRPATRLDMQSGGAWADVNNDGLQDFLLTSSCRCTPARLYMQTPSGEFSNSTHGSGLWGVSLGPDLAWGDFNNDGKIDFCSFSEGRLRLFENVRVQAGGNFAEIDLYDRNGVKSGIGSTVTVYAGPERYSQEIAAGRGKGMQEPDRLHFGIGLNQKVDSVVVTWGANRGREVFRDVEVNQVNSLKSGSFSGREIVAEISADVSPNPFADRTTLNLELGGKSYLQVDIYTAGGSYVTTLAEGLFDAGTHHFTWDGKDRSGAIVSQGAYLYRISGGGREVIGKIVRQK